MNDSQECEYTGSNACEAKSTLVSRNITVFNRRTSVRLEPEMWMALREIARREKCTIHDICSLIGVRKNANTSLTAAIRVFLMLYFRSASTETGHHNAGHGSFENMMKRARVPSEYLGYFKGQGQEAMPVVTMGTIEQNNAAQEARA